jgi:hypothetical protein
VARLEVRSALKFVLGIRITFVIEIFLTVAIRAAARIGDDAAMDARLSA